jgi:hypothetical protein
MSNNENFGFGKFVPGFDFLQSLAKGASQSLPQMPNLSNWVAPTLSVEELEKRIGELRAVHFWLDQNSKALGATIQALEVQKMTLATLRGMNFNMGELASAFKLKPTESVFGGGQKAGSRPAEASPAPEPTPAAPAGAPKKRAARKGDQRSQGAAGVVDPLQWWGALTQQFQQIAADAMKDAAAHAAPGSSGNAASGGGGEAQGSRARAAKGTRGAGKTASTRTAKKTTTR